MSSEIPAPLERHLELCSWHSVAACCECVDERAGFVVARLDFADAHRVVSRSLCEEGWCLLKWAWPAELLD